MESHELEVSTKVLGAGNFGETRLARLKATGQPVVVKSLLGGGKKDKKQVIKDGLCDTPVCLLTPVCYASPLRSQVDLFLHEVAVHASLSRHPNVVQLIGRRPQRGAA